MTDDKFVAPAFSEENKRLADLNRVDPIDEVMPHQELVPHVWLSSAPDAGVQLGFAPEDTGFSLRMATVGRSPWVSLSYDVTFEVLREGRYLGVLAHLSSKGFVAYRACLRLLDTAGGFRDVFSEDYTTSAGGTRTLLSHIPIPVDDLGGRDGAEVHLFFQGDSFEARFEGLETVLMR